MGKDFSSALRPAIVMTILFAALLGLAYPLAMAVVKSCTDAALQLGLPEGRIPLSEAALLLATKGAAVAGAGRARATLFAVVLGMLLALLIEFAVAPRIVARENLRLWHGAGTLMYAVQWLCASFVLWRLAGSRQE